MFFFIRRISKGLGILTLLSQSGNYIIQTEFDKRGKFLVSWKGLLDGLLNGG